MEEESKQQSADAQAKVEQPPAASESKPLAEAAASDQKAEEKEVKQEDMFAIGDDSDE